MRTYIHNAFIVVTMKLIIVTLNRRQFMDTENVA